jgi:hypothetical protein
VIQNLQFIVNADWNHLCRRQAGFAALAGRRGGPAGYFGGFSRMGQFQRRSLWHGRKGSSKGIAFGMEGAKRMGRKAATDWHGKKNLHRLTLRWMFWFSSDSRVVKPV